MQCVQCRRTIPDDASVCQFCGARQPTISEELSQAGREVFEATAAVVDRVVKAAKPAAEEVSKATERLADKTAKAAAPVVEKAGKITKKVVRKGARATSEAARKVKGAAKK